MIVDDDTEQSEKLLVEAKGNKDLKPQKMTILTCFLTAALVVTFVYSVSNDGSATNPVSFIEKVYRKDKRYSYNSKWTYGCENGRCIRKSPRDQSKGSTLETCNMMCSTPSLWPKPKQVRIINRNSSTFKKNRIIVKTKATNRVQESLVEFVNIFVDNLPSPDESWTGDTDIENFNIFVYVVDNTTRLKISTNESYSLSVQKVEQNILVNISAPTYFGARHGLETLSQLIWFDSDVQKLKVLHDVTIYDSPAFPHRGLMVDTARNYFPVKQLLKVIDGMSASKLNVFHLHLTDSVSFPIVLPNNKIFAEYGAYSPDMVYTPKDIKGLIEYARIRGIRVILEIDAPGHVHEGWNHSEDKLIICGDDNVINGQLNPDNTRTFTVLQSLYEDLLELGTDDEMFHIGGDEVNLNCWQQTKAAQGYSDMNLFWAGFTNKMFDTVKLANKNRLPTNVVLWSSRLTDHYLSDLNYKDNLVVQYWFGSFRNILSSGHKIIFSTVGQWYLDCGFGLWKPSMGHGVCDPYTPWQTVYKYRPWSEYTQNINQVLGGEACLWSEQVDTYSLETRIWPRAAALAERLWSDLDNFDDYDVYRRLVSHRERLIQRGLKAAGMWPRWCSQNPGKC